MDMIGLISFASQAMGHIPICLSGFLNCQLASGGLELEA